MSDTWPLLRLPAWESGCHGNISKALLSLLWIQSLSRVWLFATPLTAACQASLSIQLSWLVQTPVHRVGDAIQPSHPVSTLVPRNSLVVQSQKEKKKKKAGTSVAPFTFMNPWKRFSWSSPPSPVPLFDFLPLPVAEESSHPACKVAVYSISCWLPGKEESLSWRAETGQGFKPARSPTMLASGFSSCHYVPLSPMGLRKTKNFPPWSWLYGDLESPTATPCK